MTSTLPNASTPDPSSLQPAVRPGAHKINNALGQALLALRMGKKRIIAETGAGQHGVALSLIHI